MRKSTAVKTMMLALCCLLPLMLSACGGSKASSFYVLNPLSASEPGRESTGPEPARTLSIGLGPVKVAEYLDRPQIVTRSTPATLQLAEFDRWGEPLDSSVPRVLAANLSSLLSTDNIALYPWPASTRVEYQIIVEIARLDGNLGDRALLEARWTLLAQGGKQVLLRKVSTFSERVNGPTYEALVEAQSRALAALSREVATAVWEASPDTPAR